MSKSVQEADLEACTLEVDQLGRLKKDLHADLHRSPDDDACRNFLRLTVGACYHQEERDVKCTGVSVRRRGDVT